VTDAAAAPARFVPDFVIAGAPRSGTTSLYTWLATHPGICMSSVKEPMFWSTDIAAPEAVSNSQDYAALWKHRRPGQLTGEATAVYVHSQVAVPAVLAASPAAKLILSLRNPVDMVVSLHALMVRDGVEPVADFEEAWRIDSPRSAPPPWRLVLRPYRELCAMGDHLERFLRDAPPRNRHVIRFDDLVRDPGRVYRGVLDFLGLGDDGRRAFPAKNAHRAPRLPLPPLLARIAGRLNQRVGPPRLRPALREELTDAFRPQVEKIEGLLGWDLAAWKEP
jgi:hypothetical protein